MSELKDSQDYFLKRIVDLESQLAAEVKNKKEFERDWLEACDLLAEKDKEIEKLRNRLELTATSERGRVMQIDIGECDGISCRDETIRLQDEAIERMRPVVAMLGEVAIIHGKDGWHSTRYCECPVCVTWREYERSKSNLPTHTDESPASGGDVTS